MASPLRRPRGPGGGTTKTVLTVWALLFLLAAAQPQSQPQNVIHNLRSYASSKSVAIPSDRPQPGSSPAEIPLLKLDTTTIKLTNTENKNTNTDRPQALAPADNVVRAPLARSGEIRGETSGLSSLTQARLLQDWEVENIVLLATIDGAIHARDRKTGQERWSVAVPDSPMIETIHHRRNRSGPDDSRPEDDYIFIVEPSKDGDLYIQHKDPRIGLQRLGVTVKSLAAQTPSWVDEPPLVTTAKVDSTLFTIDAASGNVLKQFNSQTTFINDAQDHSCRRINGFERDDEACEPFGTLHIGRNQYTVTITSANTGEILCTIKYAEWTPNTRDGDLQSQHVASLDSCHIQSYHNGRIIGLDNSKDLSKPFRFTHVLETPVARVYDVFRPADNSDGSAPLVVLSQPMKPLFSSQSQPWNDELTRSRVFVNRTEAGDWYALSELSYPGVTSHAPHANLLRDFAVRERDYLDFVEDIDDIIGVQTLSAAQSKVPIRATIDPPRDDPNISKEPQSALPVSPLPPPASISESLVDLKSVIIAILLGFSAFTILLRKNPALALQIQNFAQRIGYPIAVRVPATEGAVSATTANASSETVLKAQTQPQSENPIVPMAERELGMPAPQHTRSQSSSQGPAMAHGSRSDEGNENSSEGESDDEGFKIIENPEADGATEPKKKKAKRGKRGGRHNRKKKQMSPEAMDENQTVIATETTTKDGILHIGKLKLNINFDQCLGHGSNGTAVFPGSLDGREVAVKRLLRSSTSLAAKEIKHLLSSDENPHVIRYFGKEESSHFTYIALDLFTASLDQFIEHPDRYPTLVAMPEGFDVKDALKQITYGVQHLHSLKLVHRDIKPQNVLVRAVKSNRPVVGKPKLQFVISDFGLCKPLEEGPESTFAPTANHTAAGTTGWRAPELLVDSRASVAAPDATPSTSKSTSNSSDGTVVDHPSGRRATKAIDIFSLGCVYYYVMTQGRHPFDVGGTSLGRDLNIQKNNFSTKDMRELFDCEYDAEDLVMQMINHYPKARPDTQAILRHPYFWNVEDKLEFLCDVSDCYEREKNAVSNLSANDPKLTSDEKRSFEELAALESLALNVIGEHNGHPKDFLKALPKSFINGMGRQRTYTGTKMIDLLRLIRNKKNHFHDLPEDVKEEMLGGSAKGYFQFWEKKFPSLIINCHCLVLERDLKGRFGLAKYYY
jgi:serine/threonine-protein kinase/endoribonuclease IRE1